MLPEERTDHFSASVFSAESSGILEKMNRISSFHVVYVAITILFLSRFCVFGREKSSTVHRWRRSTDDDSIRFQQQHKKPAHESNVDVKKENTSISKDHYKNDKIVFEPENIYNSKTTQRTLDSPSLIPSLFAIRRDSLIKSNETTHQYFGKANGEYEFRWGSFFFYLSPNQNVNFIIWYLIYCSSLTIRNGIRRIESGEYEDHNNQKVFVVRGFFEYITTDVNWYIPTESNNQQSE